MGGRGNSGSARRSINTLVNRVQATTQSSLSTGSNSEAMYRDENRRARRIDDYNTRLLTEGRFANRLERDGTVNIPRDYYSGSDNDFVRLARSMGYNARYDRPSDSVTVSNKEGTRWERQQRERTQSRQELLERRRQRRARNAQGRR